MELITLIKNFFKGQPDAHADLNSNFAELEEAVNSLSSNKANLNSPVLTGTPTVPTPSSKVITQQIANGAFLDNYYTDNGLKIISTVEAADMAATGWTGNWGSARKNKNNIVFVYGRWSYTRALTVADSGMVVFTLPNGLRPSNGSSLYSKLICFIGTTGASGAGQITFANAYGNGQVQLIIPVAPPSTGSFVEISGMFFTADTATP